jgi:hypothetical protein
MISILLITRLSALVVAVAVQVVHTTTEAVTAEVVAVIQNPPTLILPLEQVFQSR